MESKGGKKVAQDLDNVAKATERVGKNQTRLGQASASAGRSFAAQSQGLGGVVGVYAAAAANVFALTAAFTALNRAAQFETILRGTESLANAVGTNSSSVVNSLKNITAGQLSIVEAATQANLALSAGFNVDQIEQLGAVALKASRALGRNLTDAFQRITRGAIKLEPELLDEIGIFTRIEPAVAAYAASLNKAASSLTQFERRQAFVTQVIKDGQAAFQDIADSGESTQEVFERLVANFADLALGVGKVLADTLVPFAKFLDQNLGNRLALLGAVGLLVFGRLKTAIGAFAVEGLGALSTRLSNVADSFANTTKNAAAFTQQASAASAAFVGGGALPGAGRAQGAEIKRQLGAGGFTTQQALKLQKEIQPLLDNETAVRASLNENIKKGVISQQNFSKELEQSEIRTQGLQKTSKLVEAQINASSKSGLRFAGALNVAAVAARGLGAALKSAFAIFQAIAIAITSLQIIGSLFDFDLIGELTDAYKEFTAESRRTKAGLQDIINAAKKGTPVFDALTSSISGTSEELAVAVAEGAEKAGLKVNRLTNDANLLRRELEALQSGGFSGFFAREFTLSFKSVEERIKILQAELRATDVALNANVENFVKLGLVVGTLAEKSDVAGSSLGGAVAKGLLDLDEGAEKVILKLSGGNIVLGEFANGNLKLKDKIEEGAAVAVDFAGKLEDLQNKIQDGRISADKAGSSFGVLGNQAKKAIDLLVEAGFAEEAAKIAESMNNARESTGKLVTEIVALNTFSKTIAKEFSGAFKAVDESLLKGGFNLMGEFAVSTEQANLNQSNLLKNIVQQARTIEDINDGGMENLAIGGKINELRTLETQIIKATEGRQLKLVETLDKQRKSLEKATKQLQNQLDILRQQNEISEIGFELAEKQAKLATDQATQSRLLKNAEKSLEIVKEQVKNQESLSKSNKDLLNLQQQITVELLKQKNAESSLKDLRAGAAADRQTNAAQRTLDVMETRGISSRKELIEARLKVEERTNERELLAIKQREQAAIRDYILQSEVLDNKVASLEKEFEIETEKRKNAALAIQDAATIEKIRFDNQKANIEAQSGILNTQVTQASEQKKLAELQAKINKDSRLADLNLERDKALLVQGRIAADKEILRGNEIILKGYTQVANALTGGSLPEIKIDATGINTKNIDAIIGEYGKQIKATGDIYTEQVKAADLAEKTAVTALQAQIEKLKIESQGNQELFDRTKQLNETKLQGLRNEQTIAQAIIDSKISAADLERQSIQDALILKLEQAGIERETAIASLEYAKEKARYELDYQARMDAANAASQAIVADYVDNGLMKLNDALIDGSITMGMVGDTFKDMVGNMLRDIQKAVFQKTISDPIAGIISSSVGSIFPTGTPAVGTPTTMFTAQGGRVHMAQGGMPNAATMKRDRVPAMLEPGEFVMRKEAVKQAGLGTMMRMNAAPQQLQSGGKVMQGNATYSVARAMELEAMGLTASQARTVAQDEANKSKSVGGAFSFSDNVINNMKGAPSTPSISGNQSLGTIRDMLGLGTPAPVGQSSIGRSMPGMAVPTSKPSRAKSLGDMIDEGLMDFGKSFTGKAKSIEDSVKDRMSIDLAPLMESFGMGPQSSLAPTTSGIMNVGLFDSLTGNQSKSKQKSLKDRFKGTKPRTKPQGVGSFFKGVYNSVADAVGLNTIATAGQSVKGFYDSSSVYSDSGAKVGSASGAKVGSASAPVSKGVDLMTPGLSELANSLMENNKLSAEDAMTVAMGIAGSKEGFNPRGNLADVIGADGFRGIPLSIVGAMLGFDVPNLFSRDPSMPTNQQGKARLEVNRRTGQMATGYKGSFKPGDVTNSGNFMRADETGVVSGIDPFALDKLGYSGGVAATMGGSKGFRAAGSPVEFSSLQDFITANFVAPGRQSALTVAEYNAMSKAGREGYAPGLGGGRALSNTQRAQLSAFGGYSNIGGGYTIPGGTFSGTIKSASTVGGNFVSGLAAGFSSDSGGGFGGVAGGSMGGVSASGSGAFDAMERDDFQGFAEEASGGLVRKMAAGGAVQSRDRVPALLEPGEFVIRRPSAKAIGGAALNQMNATGKNLTPPNIQVNLNNQGAPKNVQAAAPRVQGDKIIIDMITRDLRNNGPIKKSLRK